MNVVEQSIVNAQSSSVECDEATLVCMASKVGFEDLEMAILVTAGALLALAITYYGIQILMTLVYQDEKNNRRRNRDNEDKEF